MEKQLFQEIKSLKGQIETLNLSTKDILNVDEAIAYLQVSKSCLYSKTCQKQIPYYKPPGCKRIYFRKAELEEWLLSNKVKTVAELEDNTQNYLLQNSKNN